MNCPRCNGPANEETLREFGGVCPKCLLQFSEEQDAPAFPNLEIVEMIGQGGMGVVYKARQKNLDRIVALKVLSPHLSEDPEFVERFTREAKALAQLSHPNIVGIHDSGIHDRVPYLVMEYVDGTPLRGVIAGGKLTPARALEVIPQICDALQYAHANGIVHRDIKPENILIDRQGRVKIADFGLAKLSADPSGITQSGYVLGTPRYMAPEQFEPSARVDHRADIYSLGVVFYEMLTGEVPMGRFKPPSEKAAVDRRLDPVVLKSLEREPEDRWQSADEVKQRVARLDVASVEPTLVWNGIPILITSFLNPRYLYTASETTVYVDGRKLGSSCRFWADRIIGPFHDREGRVHTLDVKAGIGLHDSSCKVTIDGTFVWQGDVPIQNLKYGYGMFGSWFLGGAGAALAAFTLPSLLPIVIPMIFATDLALVVHGLRARAPRPDPEGGGPSAGEAKDEVAGLHSRPAPSPAPLVAPRPRRNSLFVGCLIVLIAGMSLVAILVLLMIPRSMKSAPEPAATVTAPYRPATSSWGELHYLNTSFDLDKVWPAAAEFPAGSDPGTEYQGEDALQRAGLPKAMLADLKIIRIVGLGDGQALLLGLKFKNEVARRQWSRDQAYQAVISSWNCRLEGESDSTVLLKHNDSNRGVAIAQTLWPVVKAKWGKAK